MKIVFTQKTRTIHFRHDEHPKKIKYSESKLLGDADTVTVDSIDADGYFFTITTCGEIDYLLFGRLLLPALLFYEFKGFPGISRYFITLNDGGTFDMFVSQAIHWWKSTGTYVVHLDDAIGTLDDVFRDSRDRALTIGCCLAGFNLGTFRDVILRHLFTYKAK